MTPQRRKNIAILAISSAFLIGILIVNDLFHLSCPLRWATGIPCPGCGGTRTALFLMRGNIWEALWTNPLSFLLIIFFAISGVWILIDIVRNSDTYTKIYSRPWNKKAVVLVVILLAANWVWNIFKFGIG